MDVTTILIILLVGAAATYFSGDKLASKVALLFSVGAFAATIALLASASNGADVVFSSVWISNPQINLAFLGDGLSLVMVLLTTSLMPLIVYSGFGTDFKNARAIYGLMLFMAFAMCGTFLAGDGLLYYIFWELALVPIYFIALLWGNGDAEERKKAVVKFFIYTFAGSLFMLAAFAYLSHRARTILDIPGVLRRVCHQDSADSFPYLAGCGVPESANRWYHVALGHHAQDGLVQCHPLAVAHCAVGR